MMAGTVVKCIFAFTGEVETDLSLDVGDLIKITKVLSDYWYEGNCNGKVGQFPKAFVEKTSEVFEMALAVSHFPGEEAGDLTLNKGDVVIITEIIDDNWAVGHTHGGHKGTFPRAFVKEISFEDSAMKNALQAAVDATVESSEETTDETVGNDDKFTVVSPFSAQSDTELDLKMGMIVEVLNVYDDFWLEGSVSNGKKGIFPKTCIDFPDSKMPNFDKKEEQNSQEQCLQESAVKTESECVNEIQSAKIETGSTNEEFLEAVFDYNSTTEGDLSFKTGDTIKILDIIDENWYRGEFDGNTGVFPSNHVEKITSKEVYEPEDKNVLSVSEATDSDNISTDSFPPPPSESSDNVSTDSFPPPPPDEVLSDIEENINKDAIEEQNTTTANTKIDLTDAQQLPAKPTRKPAPGRPAAGPKRPQKPSNKPSQDRTESVTEKTPTPVLEKPLEKPKKKAPPERPKMPTVKKDIIPPFSYTFSTESQPTVIISGNYVKPGEPNIIILRKSVQVS